MTHEAALTALAHYNRQRSKDKHDAVRAALTGLIDDPHQPINKSVVARHAGVSREFINTHPELKTLIERAAHARHRDPRPSAPTTHVAELDGLRAQNRTYTDTITRQKQVIAELRATITELGEQRKLHLGAQLAASAFDIDAHRRLQLDHDRLTADHRQLSARLDELERLLARTTDDLTASRRAHAEDLARLGPSRAHLDPAVVTLPTPDNT